MLLLTGCINVFELADLTENHPDINVSYKARGILEKMGEAHGIKQYENINTYTVLFEDEFYGKMGQFANPYTELKTQFELNYIPKTFNGRLIFNSGKNKGLRWGIQAWHTYEQKPGESIRFRKNKTAEFWLPTYQYFVEFPLRIQEASALKLIGEKVIDGKGCIGVVASWGTTAPQKSTDQYVLWIDKVNYRLHKLEYTIRDINRFVTGVTSFKDYKNYDGILLPAQLLVESNLLKEGYLHEMRILNFAADQVNREELLPNKELGTLGEKK